MASYNELNALIDAYINRNGVQAITGQILNGVLKAMVEQLGRGYTIMGAAIPTTDPGTPDGPECYFASETGTYTDFDGLQVVPGELALLCYTPTDGWTKATIYEGFQEVEATIDGNVGTPSVGVSYANGVLSFDFHNMKGNPGQNGQDGAAAGFGTIGADITGGVGTPAVTVESSGPATAKNLQFHFTNLKGETGVTSVVATVDNTTGTPTCTVSLEGQQLTLAFSGLKGAQGDTGSSVDYPFTIVNNLTTDDATQALSAAQGVVLEGKVTQLEAEVTEFESDVNGRTFLKNLVWTNGYIANTGAIKNDSASKFTQPFVLKKGQKVTIGTANSSITIIGTTSSASLSVGDSVTPLQTTGYPETFETHTYTATEDTTIVLCVRWANYTLSFQQTETMEMEIGNINERLDVVEGQIWTEEESIVDVPLTVRSDGYYISSNGTFVADTTRRRTDVIDVEEGEKYLVTTKIGGTTVIAYLAQWNGNIWVGVAPGFTGGSGDAVDKLYTVPPGVTKIAICSYNTTPPSLKKVTNYSAPNFYTKFESDERFVKITSGKYGVKWSLTDINDLGQRTLDAVGKNATIGIGSTVGSSDFDGIYPWSGMRRCNIKSNANGASIITFEGETGFALDGSNGDVFVRIPKFKTDHYVKDGYEHIVIGDGYVHPAFIEDGEELDEIFIGAFEASGDSSALFSKGGVIPANNITGASFLAGAKARGTKYSLYDMRCVDALWRLMAVEYGCRNSNRIFGWGYANFTQPDNLSHLKVVVSAQNTNTITLAKPTLNSIRVEFLQSFASGNNLCICENTQENIIAQRKIVSVECASLDDNVVITFEGDPIDVNTDMFVGNAPCDCNYCETIGDSWKLNWHTGRANRPVLSGIGFIAETCNPCRYRWVENPVGNVWHSLPDVTFKDLQMYVCKNMKDYEMLRYTPPYMPIGAILPEQNSNGHKNDVNTIAQPNYWITGLLMDIFAKGNNFGKSFDTAHDGTITSTKGFGGYYYLYNDTRYIANGGGYDHLWRCNMLTNRAWQNENTRWYLYGARLMFKNI